MASETAVPVYSTNPEQDKQEVHEVVKTIIEDKESGKEEKAKVEDSPSQAMPFVESKENIEAKQNEPSIIEEEVKKIGEEEKPKADSPSLVVPLTESKENIEDKKIEPPVIEEVKKSEQIEKPKVENSPSPPILLAESKENIENKQTGPLVIKEDAKEEKLTDSPSPVVHLTESKEKIEDKPIVPPVIEEELKKYDEVEKSKVDLPSPTVILVGSKESTDDKQIEPPVKENEEPVLAVTNKLQEQSEVAEEIKKETEEKSPVIEPKEILGAEVEKSETENAKTEEENRGVYVTAANPTPPETKEVEDVCSSIAVQEVTERSLDLKSEDTSTDTALVAESGKEDIKDEAVISDETSGAIKEQKQEKPEVEVKGDETEKTDETKLKKEVSPKSTQKQSITILAKMKQTLIKAKKAIIGKSTNSKSPSSETKGDVKV